MDIILFHKDCESSDQPKNLPEWTEYCLKQIRFFNDCNIYFLTNKSNMDNPMFKKYNVNVFDLNDYDDDRIETFSSKFYGTNSFWNVTAIRFFNIEQFIRKHNLTNVIHFENDILLYESLKNIEDKITNTYEHLAITPGGQDRCMTGFFFIKDYESIAHMNNYFYTIVMNNKIDGFKAQFNTSAMVSEMFLLMVYSKMHPERLKYFPIMPFDGHNDYIDVFNSLFDPASWGQFVGGSRAEGVGCKPADHFIGQMLRKNLNYYVNFEEVDGYKKPYFHYDDNKIFINNLHIHSKNLKEYVSK